MIELDSGPAILGMAALAFLAVMSFVLIVVDMAFGTLGWNTFVTLINVARLAFYPDVFTLERELRLAVIEEECLPFGFLVADVAALAELRLVRIVLFVAIDTLRGRLTMFFVRRMAAAAANTLVTVMQLVVGLVVIEGGNV